jgi:hypothetical protein
MTQSKPSMSFSQLVYAINNRGKTMNLAATKAMIERVVEPETQQLDEAGRIHGPVQKQNGKYSVKHLASSKMFSGKTGPEAENKCVAYHSTFVKNPAKEGAKAAVKEETVVEAGTTPGPITNPKSKKRLKPMSKATKARAEQTYRDQN